LLEHVLINGYTARCSHGIHYNQSPSSGHVDPQDSPPFLVHSRPTASSRLSSDHSTHSTDQLALQLHHEESNQSLSDLISSIHAALALPPDGGPQEFISTTSAISPHYGHQPSAHDDVASSSSANSSAFFDPRHGRRTLLDDEFTESSDELAARPSASHSRTLDDSPRYGTFHYDPLHGCYRYHPSSKFGRAGQRIKRFCKKAWGRVAGLRKHHAQR
jgi:hypothetical protein